MTSDYGMLPPNSSPRGRFISILKLYVLWWDLRALVLGVKHLRGLLRQSCSGFSQILLAFYHTNKSTSCEEGSGENVLPFVNTPTVARDIASIVDALHADSKTMHHVCYWGFSYGTNLGAIFAAMFPNKLHRIVLDGIRSPIDAREIYEWGYTSLASQNDMVEGYFEICEKAGEQRCPLAGGKATLLQISPLLGLEFRAREEKPG